MKRGLNPASIQFGGREPVKVEAAVEALRPSRCLIRSAQLNRQLRITGTTGENAKRCLRLSMRALSGSFRRELQWTHGKHTK